MTGVQTCALPIYLCHRTCDEGMLVFNEKNGQTSLLSDKSAFVLSCLSQRNQGHELEGEVDLRIACAMNNESDLAEFNLIVAALRTSGLIIGG